MHRSAMRAAASPVVISPTLYLPLGALVVALLVEACVLSARTGSFNFVGFVDRRRTQGVHPTAESTWQLEEVGRTVA